MKNIIAAVSIGVALLLPVGAASAFPENEFVCSVETMSEQTAVVMVQAHDEAGAVEVAGGGVATRLDGVKEQVKTVLQCIDFPQGRFQDPKLQAFVDAMPR